MRGLRGLRGILRQSRVHALGGGGLVTITWAAPLSPNAPALDGYRIYKNGLLIHEVGAVLTYDIEAVPGDEIIVVSYNDAGESDDSNTLTIT